MPRPRFDPEKAPGSPAPGAGQPLAGSFSVSEVAALVARALEDGLPAKMTMVGEISGFNSRTHWYFRVKDDGAVIDCVMFASAARKSGLAPEDGWKVSLTGRVEFFARQGRTQFYAESMAPLGAGALEARYRALCDELRALGWFAPERKRPLPSFPRRIAVITSRTGAALQDVLDTMRRRCPAVEAVLIDVRVQGEGAAPEIAHALRRVSSGAGSLGVDAVILTRGGGSLEDLWAFNDREVARAIVECRIPVVAAIGHETDTTIAELVADHRCATPTQAAMVLTPDRESLMEELARLDARLVSALRRGSAFLRQRAQNAGTDLLHAARHLSSRTRVRVEGLAARLAHLRPAEVYALRRASLHERSARLHAAVQNRLRIHDPAALATDLDRAWAISFDRRRQRLASLERELVITGPLSVLRRGYSVTTGPDGRIIRSVGQTRPGEQIRTRLADGSVRSRVEAAEDQDRSIGPGHAPALPQRQPPTPPPRRKRAGPDKDQMSLF